MGSQLTPRAADIFQRTTTGSFDEARLGDIRVGGDQVFHLDLFR